VSVLLTGAAMCTAGKTCLTILGWSKSVKHNWPFSFISGNAICFTLVSYCNNLNFFETISKSQKGTKNYFPEPFENKL
jgi:hypothetical protein